VPNPSILVAAEPRTYRDVLAAALAHLRPDANAVAIEPADLAEAVTAHRPALVILSEPNPTVESAAPAWILLYPGGANRAVAVLEGACHTIERPRLADLLALVDRSLALVAP
jgi:hypothetical protein